MGKVTMIRYRTDLDVKDIKQFHLSGFRGVDFSSSPLNVTESRATDAKNWIYDHGSPTKRPGWKQIAYVNGYAVNGIYKYTTGYYLVYAGTKFFKVQITTTGVGYVTTEISTVGMVLTSNQIQFFPQDSTKIFIVGAGDFLVWYLSGTWKLEKVFDNSMTYVPTTTISIDYEGYSGTSLKATLEAPSLMTVWRKNTCKGVTGSASESPVVERTYILDGNVSIDTTSATAEQAYVDIEFLDGTVQTQALIGFYDSVSGGLKLKESVGAATIYGYIYTDGTMTLETVTEPPTADDNITVKFRGYNDDEYNSGNISDHVRAAKFGVLFGVDGVTSQLFMSGANITTALKIKNRDFYSYPLDFTYWPDNFYRIVGNSAIKGYHRIGDGSLVIFKEKAYGEASIFLRTGTLVTGTEDGYYTAEITYSERAGYASDYLSTRMSIETLAGDPLYLTQGGVKGIVLSENVSTDERFARGRSYFIDKKLEEYTLANATAITYKDRYYLCIDDDCFVADSRLKANGELHDTFNYEWMFWDNIPARIFTEIDNNLYFGTADGKICVFDTEFTDRPFEVIVSGLMTFQAATDTIAYDSSLTLAEDDSIKFEYTYLHELVFEKADGTLATNVFTLSTDAGKARLLHLNELDELLLVAADETSVTVYASNVDYGTYSFEIVDINGDPIDMSSGYDSFWLIKPIHGIELFIKNLDTTDKEFQLARYLGDSEMRLINYNTLTKDLDDTVSLYLTSIVIAKDNVNAEYYSMITDLSTNVLSKTLLSITITGEGEMTFGYYTRIAQTEREFVKASGFSFLDFDFTNFSFTAFKESFTRKIKEKNVNYMMFKVSVDTDKTCTFNNLSVRFKYNGMNRGVK